MDEIKSWIICILIGAFIINIVDMVLPESKLKPYINLVCNFIFIFIVISPIVGFFSSDESFEDKILKSMTDYNERYVESNKDLVDNNSNFNLDSEYQSNLKDVLKMKLDEYGYELEDIDFNGTDIESLKIKEKNNEGDSELEENSKDKDSSSKDSEVFKNNTTNKSENKDKLKNDLIKILEVSIDKIELINRSEFYV